MTCGSHISTIITNENNWSSQISQPRPLKGTCEWSSLTRTATVPEMSRAGQRAWPAQPPSWYKNVRFRRSIGSSWTSHKDGELVQVSETNVLWEIEDGPDDQYRYVWTLSLPAHRLKLGMSKAFDMTQTTDTGVLMTGQTAQLVDCI